MSESAAALDCRVVSEPAELVRLSSAWAALLETSDSNEPTLSPQWLLTWWRVFGAQQGRRLCAVAFEENGRLVGLAPLLHRTSWYRGCVPFRRLEPLGAGEQATDAICSEYLNVLAERGAEGRVAVRLVGALASGDLGEWDELVFPMMNGAGPMPGLLAGACRKAGLMAQTVVTMQAPYIPLPSTWDAYLQLLSKTHRHYIRSALRDFDAWAGADQRFEQVTAPAALEKGLQILVSLHRQRWHNTAQGGAFRSPHFLAFHDAILPQLLGAKALQMIWLHAQGRPVAAMYNIVWNNKVYFYQSGRDPTLPGRLRPGIVIIAKAIQQAIAAGRREFDFLGGSVPYKMQLALANRPLVQLRVARSSVRETVRLLLEAGAARYRHLQMSPLIQSMRGREPSQVQPHK